jgi:hypothetical protein
MSAFYVTNPNPIAATTQLYIATCRYRGFTALAGFSQRTVMEVSAPSQLTVSFKLGVGEFVSKCATIDTVIWVTRGSKIACPTAPAAAAASGGGGGGGGGVSKAGGADNLVVAPAAVQRLAFTYTCSAGVYTSDVSIVGKPGCYPLQLVLADGTFRRGVLKILG